MTPLSFASFTEYVQMTSTNTVRMEAGAGYPELTLVVKACISDPRLYSARLLDD